MSHKVLLASVVGSLMLFGVGCSSDQSATTVDVTPPVAPKPTSTADIVSVPPAPSSVSSTASSTDAHPTSMIDTSGPLAFPGILPTAEVSVKVRVHTTLGDIVIQVMPDQGPRAASNFVYLVKRHFYDGTIFHRVIPSFMIQGGDPTGTGGGGPGYQFPNDDAKIPYTDGVVAMANAGRDTNGSQFFIMVADVRNLPPDYSIFGKVVSGLSVAHKIADVPRDGSDRPNTDVKMLSVTVEK